MPSAKVLSTNEAAELLRLTPRRLQKLAREGWIKKAAPGRYRLHDIVHGYLDFRDDADRRASKSAADSRVRDARAAEIEQRVATRASQLVARDDHMAVLDEIVGTIRASFSGLPARMTRDLVLRKKIEKAVDDIFERAADRLERRAGELEASRAARPAAQGLDA